MKIIDTHLHYYDGIWPPGEHEPVTLTEMLGIMDAQRN